MGIYRRNSGLSDKKFRFCPTKVNLLSGDLLKKTSLFVPRNAINTRKRGKNLLFAPLKEDYIRSTFFYLYRIRRKGLYIDYRLRSAKVTDNQYKPLFSWDR